MQPPSTAWQETIGADEDARFEGYAAQLVALQAHAATSDTVGRALHRKQHLGLRATVDILDGLPAHARHGLAAAAGRHDATIRLSNASHARAADRKPDIRGFALRIGGVDGEGALGGAATAQCFLLINTPTFALPTVEEFVEIVQVVAKGPLAILRAMIRRHGFLGGLKRVRLLQQNLAKPFAGFARETFHTAAPIAWGPYAAKLRLVPTAMPDGPRPTPADWSADVVARLAGYVLTWDLQAQFFVSEAVTPIEDPTVLWPEAEAPFVTVARVTAPAQAPGSPEGQALAADIEAGTFDPWVALAAHRPLGEIMRARKPVYFASQRARAAR